MRHKCFIIPKLLCRFRRNHFSHFEHMLLCSTKFYIGECTHKFPIVINIVIYCKARHVMKISNLNKAICFGQNSLNKFYVEKKSFCSMFQFQPSISSSKWLPTFSCIYLHWGTPVQRTLNRIIIIYTKLQWYKHLIHFQNFLTPLFLMSKRCKIVSIPW